MGQPLDTAHTRDRVRPIRWLARLLAIIGIPISLLSLLSIRWELEQTAGIRLVVPGSPSGEIHLPVVLGLGVMGVAYLFSLLAGVLAFSREGLAGGLFLASGLTLMIQVVVLSLTRELDFASSLWGFFVACIPWGTGSLFLKLWQTSRAATRDVARSTSSP